VQVCLVKSETEDLSWTNRRSQVRIASQATIKIVVASAYLRIAYERLGDENDKV
jgi:hypothetical protein